MPSVKKGFTEKHIKNCLGTRLWGKKKCRHYPKTRCLTAKQLIPAWTSELLNPGVKVVDWNDSQKEWFPLENIEFQHISRQARVDIHVGVNATDCHATLRKRSSRPDNKTNASQLDLIKLPKIDQPCDLSITFTPFIGAQPFEIERDYQRLLGVAAWYCEHSAAVLSMTCCHYGDIWELFRQVVMAKRDCPYHSLLWQDCQTEREPDVYKFQHFILGD